MKQNVVNISNLGSTDQYLIGGKGAALAGLLANGFNVPEAFCVTTIAQDNFFTDSHIYEIFDENRIHLISEDNIEIATAAKKMRDAIISANFSESLNNSLQKKLSSYPSDQQFAVRSSAIVEDSDVKSWAGQFDSFLFVHRDDVPYYIKLCWASLFSSRAIAYDRNAFVDISSLGFSVIVQEMIDADVSGVAFSVDPTTGDTSKVIIEAVKGTGESLVSGLETPFSAAVDKSENIVLRRGFGSKSKAELLAPSQLGNITSICSEIEVTNGFPVDVEWALKGDNLFILQARPITALHENLVEEKNSQIPDHLGYELTFKVTGLSFLFSDMLIRGFGYLNPLLTNNESEFRQYFPIERMEFAAREGYRWLSDKNGFIDYQLKFEEFHEKSRNDLEAILSSEITEDSVLSFFSIIERYFYMYSHTDFQFTNLTYLYAAENPVISENLRLLAEFKDVARIWINETAIEDNSYFARFIDLAANRINVNTEFLEAFKISEIIDALNGNIVDQSILEERNRSFVIFMDHGTVKYVSGFVAEAYIEQIISSENRLLSSKVVGQVANKTINTIEGVVSKINVDYANMDIMNQNMNEMTEGTILVSEFTAPELMPACMKASAIITDLGGMLSHAAIISRELGISCLVGTRNASRSFDSNDQIFLDLEQGLASKLTKT